MTRHEQLPHGAVKWLLLATLWAVLPALLRGPAILLVAVVLLLGWRWQVARTRLAMPSLVVRTCLLLLLVLVILWHYHTIFGPNAGVALLVACFALKVLGLGRLRDAYWVVLLGYFVLAMVFLFQHGSLMTLYVAVGFIIFTASLVSLQASDAAHAANPFALATRIFLQALPLFLVIFVVVPRVAPLWGVSLNSGAARTGLSNSMNPGSIRDVAQSSEPVFRVKFQGAVPPPDARYWRGLTYSWFDGEGWHQAMAKGLPKAEVIHYPGQPDVAWFNALKRARAGHTPSYRYRVLMEPSGRRWLFSLDVAFSRTPDVGLARDFRLVRRQPVNNTLAYRVESYTRLAKDKRLAGWLRRLNLTLPPTGNPQTRALAKKWRAHSGSDQAFIAKVLDWFHRQPFYYTLHPPEMAGPNGIDSFLFESRHGFCADYASAFAVMMRAAGIPARIVAGYQGGEINPLGGYLQVRQYDAHAWDEVWLKGRGWVREDPTAAVAPARVEKGLLGAVDGRAGPDGAFESWASGGLLGRLGMFSDYLGYSWQRWVVNYDQRRQQSLFKHWFSSTHLWRLLWWGAATLLILVALAYFRWRMRRKLSAWQWQYRRLYRALQKRGVAVTLSQSPQQLVTQASVALPAKREALRAWLAAYQALAYAPRGSVAEERRRLAHLKRCFPFKT